MCLLMCYHTHGLTTEDTVMPEQETPIKENPPKQQNDAPEDDK